MTNIVLSVFASLVLFSFLHCIEASSERELLLPYLYVDCQPNKMAVILGFSRKFHSEITDELRDMLWRGKVCIGSSNSEKCCSKLNMTKEFHIASCPYKTCGMESNHDITGFNFIAQVKYYSVRNVVENFEAKCTVPYVKLRTEVASMEIDLSVTDFYRLKEPLPKLRTIKIGSSLFLIAGSINHSLQQRPGTYPLKCWVTIITSQRSMQYSRSTRRDVIDDGCPLKYKGKPLAIIVQNNGSSPFAEWTKVRIPVSADLLAPIEMDKKSHFGNITVSCDYLVCRNNMLATFQDVPLCPRNEFCSKEDPQIPDWLSPYDSATQLAEMDESVRVVSRNSSDTDDLVSISDLKFVDLEVLPTEKEITNDENINDVKKNQEVPCRRLEGIPISVVVLIATLSFTFGLVFVALLWIIHNKTDPMRKVRCSDRSMLHLAQPANGTALMSMPAQERQRLVVERS